MNWSVSWRCGSDPELLWLWCRLVAVAPIQALAWELSYAAGAALKKKKTNKIILLFCWWYGESRNSGRNWLSCMMMARTGGSTSTFHFTDISGLSVSLSPSFPLLPTSRGIQSSSASSHALNFLTAWQSQSHWASSVVISYVFQPEWAFYLLLFKKNFLMILIFSIIVGLQCSVNFYCTAKWPSLSLSHTHIFFFSHYLPSCSITGD